MRDAEAAGSAGNWARRQLVFGFGVDEFRMPNTYETTKLTCWRIRGQLVGVIRREMKAKAESFFVSMCAVVCDCERRV